MAARLSRARAGLGLAALLGTVLYSPPAPADPAIAHDAQDASRMPGGQNPSVHELDRPSMHLSGWSHTLGEPAFSDRRRRIPDTRRPAAFGHTLQPGEGFRFDVSYAGNPSGLAEAKVVAIEPDPRGPPPLGAPLIRLEGHARTSGVVSLLATVTDDLVTFVDARSGAPVTSRNVIDYRGLRLKYRHRVTVTDFEGRGHIRIVDKKDERTKRKTREVPLDTFDPLSAMAWVRALRLEPGEQAKAHAMDGTALLRVEIVSRGRKAPKELPQIAQALEIGRDDLEMIEGELTRVDEYDQPLPGKRTYTLRAWLSSDERRIPLLMESDMWLGSIRLELTHYDPPR